MRKKAKGSMNENPFHIFINFAKADAELEKVLKEKQKVEGLIEEKQKSLFQIEQLNIQHSNKVHILKKQLDIQELENRTLSQALIAKKLRLEHTQSPREYISLQNEIEQLSHKENEQEDILMALLQEYEKASTALASLKAENLKKQAALEKEKNAYEKQLNILEEKIKENRRITEETQKIVVPEWLQKYQDMKTRVSNPVVPVEQNVCSACYYAVSQPDLQALRKHKLLQCKDCYRFLYIL